MTIKATPLSATMHLRKMWSPAFAQHSRRCADIAAAEITVEAFEKPDSSIDNPSGNCRPLSSRV